MKKLLPILAIIFLASCGDKNLAKMQKQYEQVKENNEAMNKRLEDLKADQEYLREMHNLQEAAKK